MIKTIPLHSNERTMENLTKGIVETYRIEYDNGEGIVGTEYGFGRSETPMDKLVEGLAEDEEKILSNTLLCTQINEGILIDRG